MGANDVFRIARHYRTSTPANSASPRLPFFIVVIKISRVHGEFMVYFVVKHFLQLVISNGANDVFRFARHYRIGTPARRASPHLPFFLPS